MKAEKIKIGFEPLGLRGFDYTVRMDAEFNHPLREEIAKVNGVEFCHQTTRYSSNFRIGELFDAQSVMNAVESKIRDYFTRYPQHLTK